MLQVLFGNELCDASENELILKRYVLCRYNDVYISIILYSTHLVIRVLYFSSYVYAYVITPLLFKFECYYDFI